MKAFSLITILLLGEILISSQQEESSSFRKSTPNDPYYIAGVVEFQRNLRHDDNLEGYQKIIESDEAKTVDIILFPEATLNNLNSAVYVPNPKQNVIPCNSSDNNISTTIKRISCLAQKHQKYIVINLSEKENCTLESQKQKNDTRPCSQNGLNNYNTNVVFDRNGTVILKYRKWNLYSEEGTNTTIKPEYATFQTDFGVTFGLFTCFDILFYTPTQELVEMGIKDFLFPTMWFSELPFLTAVQSQSQWAYANDVNLLAAGASNPTVGSTGTGIYSGKKGALIRRMSSVAERKIYVAKVFKKNSNQQSDPSTTTTTALESNNNETITENTYERLKGLSLLRDNINNYNTTFLDLNKLEENKTICSGSLCCKFYVKWTKPLNSSSSSSSSSSYQYVLATYEGERTYQNRDSSYIRICGLIACTKQNISSCGTVFPDDENVVNQFIFNEIQIQGNFINLNSKKNNNNKDNIKTSNGNENIRSTSENNKRKYNGKSLIMPSNLDDTILPLPVDQFSFDITETNIVNGIPTAKNVDCHLKTPTKKSNLLTFGIYVNDFETPSKDDNNGKGSSSQITFNLMTIITSLFLIVVCKQFSK